MGLQTPLFFRKSFRFFPVLFRKKGRNYTGNRPEKNINFSGKNGNFSGKKVESFKFYSQVTADWVKKKSSWTISFVLYLYYRVMRLVIGVIENLDRLGVNSNVIPTCRNFAIKSVT